MVTRTFEDCDPDIDPECYSAPIVVPWETDYAALVPRFTGGLSAISSMMIIYIIMRSKTRLSSIYHRIMFGMSLADICGSVAMALTSLPMPSYMPKEEIFGYRWAGTRLGNTYTCNAQGFFAFFGMGCMFNYNAMLCLYYACAIAFTMRERNIKKYVEPILHGLPVLAGLSFSIPPLFYEMYNPGISTYAWCGPVPYPNECGIYESVQCIRGNSKYLMTFRIMIAVVILYVFCIIAFSLGMVIWKVIQTDHMINYLSKFYRDRGREDMTKVLEKHRNSKAVLVQACSYITAFLLGVTPPLLLSVGAVDTSGKTQVTTVDQFEKITLIFLPLQGFFNFIIFVSFKVYNYRRVHPDVSIGRVIKLLFCTSSHEPLFISRISFVKKNEEDSNEFLEDFEERNQHIYQFDVKDESNEELRYRLGLMETNNSDHESIQFQAISNDGINAEGNISIIEINGSVRSNVHLSNQNNVIGTSPNIPMECQSCDNSTSKLLSFFSRDSVTNSEEMQNDLSMEEDEAQRSYYKC
jgi:hypothetical protein